MATSAVLNSQLAVVSHRRMGVNQGQRQAIPPRIMVPVCGHCRRGYPLGYGLRTSPVAPWADWKQSGPGNAAPLRALMSPVRVGTELPQNFLADFWLSRFDRGEVEQRLLHVRCQDGQVQDLGHARLGDVGQAAKGAGAGHRP